jgi:RNA polymerase sigma-70 factor, ECF subfamily
MREARAQRATVRSMISGGEAEELGRRALDLAVVYDQHAERVATWAARLLGPGGDVEDVVHEVFLVAQRRLPEFRGDAKVGTWLYEIVVRVAQEQRRRKRRRWWLALGFGGREPRVVTDALAPRGALDPLAALESKEATARLYRVLDGLAEKYRTVLVLFEIEGLSGEQIAAVTGTTVANVWVRLLRARRQFVERFQKLEEGGAG